MNTKFVSHDFKVYVGDYCLMPLSNLTNQNVTGLGFQPKLYDFSIDPDCTEKVELDCIPPSSCNPKNFFDVAESIENDVYSNNMDVVRFFKPENVICVKVSEGQKTMKPITEHPKYEKWQNEMDSGELVSLFGFDWVK